MATASKRSVARKATQKSNKALKAALKETVTRAAGKSKIEWDATRPLVAKAINAAVAHETTDAASAVVSDFANATAMIVHKQASIDHARDFLNAIRRRVCEKRGIKWKAEDHAAPANKVSDYKKVLAMASLACLTNLIANLKKIETLTHEHLYMVAVYMVGTRKQKAQWKLDAVGAPTVAVLESVIARATKRATKDTKPGKAKSKRKGVMGMPTTDAPRSLAYCDSAIAALLKAWSKSMSAAEIKQATAARNNLASLKDAMVRIKREANETPAE